jgi:hypothetical protein
MRSGFRYAVVFAVVGLGGCRQADGPMPTPTQNVQAELTDVARDLQNVSARNAQAPDELRDDLSKYTQRPTARPAVDELSRRVANVLPGSTLNDQDAQRLAHNLWVSIAAREISERQIESLQNDVQSILMAVGVAEENAQQVAAQVGEVQRAVTDRPRRWYEFF